VGRTEGTDEEGAKDRTEGTDEGTDEEGAKDGTEGTDEGTDEEGAKDGYIVSVSLGWLLGAVVVGLPVG
jgi:hypothetical protein